MNVTVFTSNQPRHVALIESLAEIADQVFAIQECNTVFPGQVADFFAKSPIMQRYFSHVMQAEREAFGPRRFPLTKRKNLTQLPIKMGDLGFLSPSDLGDAMQADVFIVFGSSYIRGPLCQHLIDHHAINIHMGISPYYRGSSCNFWALYDNNPHLVGATLHLLTSGLDSGPMIRHALPPSDVEDGFLLGMLAVASAHQALIDLLGCGRFDPAHAVPQDRSKQIRYTRNSDFTDGIANEYLARSRKLNQRKIDPTAYLHPHIFQNR